MPYLSDSHMSAFGDASVEYDGDFTLMPDIITDAMAYIATLDINNARPEHIRALELGAGAAPFLSLLAHRLTGSVSVDLVAVDSDPITTDLANFNIHQGAINHNNPNDTSTVICQDWIDLLANKGKFDVVYFNPPYLPAGEAVRDQFKKMPAASMFVEGSTDGLDHFRAVLPKALESLAPKGRLFVRTPRATQRHQEVVTLATSGLSQGQAIHPIHVRAEMGDREGGGFVVESEEGTAQQYEVGLIRAIGMGLLGAT